MNKSAANSSDPALRNLDALLPNLAELYKDVHSHPELSMQETQRPITREDAALG